MDKYEYQVCADQIKSLIKEHRFSEAMDIADTIDWRRVKSFSMLCTVSEIYKVTKHYSEARDILLLAYERYPDRANVVYALCELAIKLDDITESVEYYKEYVRLKPHDPNRYVLLYKIYDAQDVPIEEKISLLEEYKRTEYIEKWAYELALLYHKDGQETKCVETCDELVLWFGDGPIVHKALELKKQHAPLTREQQRKYDGVYEGPVINQNETEETVHIYETQSLKAYENGASPFETVPLGTSQVAAASQAEQPVVNDQNKPSHESNPNMGMTSDIQIQPVNTDKYSTINLQEELAKNMEELYAREKEEIVAPYYGSTMQLYEPSQEQFINQINQAGPVQYTTQPMNNQAQYEQVQQTGPMDYYSQTGPMNYYGQPVEGMQQAQYEQVQQTGPMNYYSQTGPMNYYGQPVEEVQQVQYEQVQQPVQYEQVQQPAQYEQVQQPVQYEQVQQPVQYEQVQQTGPINYVQEEKNAPVEEEEPVQPVNTGIESLPVYSEASETDTNSNVNSSRYDGTSGVPKDLEDKLREGLDGQMTMSLPDSGEIQKQITGQIDISDFMMDWEAKKKNIEEQRKAQIKQRSLEQTSDIMSQLAGVIPGMDNFTEEANVVEVVKDEEEPTVAKEEIIRDDDKGVVTRTTISSPSYDRDSSIKRTESGAKINGPKKSSITGVIPDILPNAAVPVKGDILPSGRRLTIEDEYGGNIAKIRQDDAELVKRLTGELPELPEEEEKIPELPDEDYETEDLVEIEQPELEDEAEDEVEETEEKPEEVVARNTGSIPPLQTDDIEKVEIPTFETPIADEKTEEEETKPEIEDEEQVDEEPVTYPYEVKDLGEVEDLVDIEQPEELDDMLKTRPIPIDEIEARQRYEAGIETDDADDKSDKKSNRRSYMEREEIKSRRDFDEAEWSIFGRYEGIESLKAQIVDVMDDMSMEGRKGNIIIMGSEQFGCKTLAVDIVKAIQVVDSSFSGKVAKISGEALNKKNIQTTLAKLKDGALIVENASGLTPVTLNTITEALLTTEDNILVLLSDEKETLEPLINGCPETKTVFDARIVVEDFNDDDLVAYAKGYAREQEYTIDEMGILALHTRIAEMQSLDHKVTIDEAMDIIDMAIDHVDKKNMSHFMDVLLGKRYDPDDYIVLREKDFLA